MYFSIGISLFCIIQPGDPANINFAYGIGISHKYLCLAYGISLCYNGLAGEGQGPRQTDSTFCKGVIQTGLGTA